MADLEQRLDQVEEIITKQSFRENKGISNEVGYYVFDYPAEQELTVRNRIDTMVKKNEKGYCNFKIVCFDLYDLIIENLKEKNFMDKCIKFEKTKGLGYVAKSIGNALNFSSDDNLITSHISENTPDNSVVFLIGVGKCFPILRSHKILNNLHQVMDKVPVVMFYPGKYDGRELVLFSEVKDDNYYRAFKLVE